MIIYKKASDVTLFLERAKNQGKTTGFVPTMGALHHGHLSLIGLSQEQNDLTCCSIFVNPTQFNNPEDFTHYPITIEKDIEQLAAAGCDLLFLPAVKEIYPQGFPQQQYDLGPIETVLEGHYRPGHFQGVCQVVDRLLRIVQPDRLYLGQKDYQQSMVVKKLIQLMGKEHQIELVVCPTIREADGLAMSSRNLRLDPEERRLALGIYKTLSYLKEQLGSHPLAGLKQEGKKRLESEGFAVDYVEIADADTLQAATAFDGQKLVALVAATLHRVRLIDNMTLN
ncbi:pantoate--beta-alanine ligase [Paraflavisolibacter sp. H34]|uniref:pantoate--beta-alanine ligase n=1 Tax=Huijunlia imazamoxiresistens TaxID=3127457 RepID=UPI00301A2C2F